MLLNAHFLKDYSHIPLHGQINSAPLSCTLDRIVFFTGNNLQELSSSTLVIAESKYVRRICEAQAIGCLLLTESPADELLTDVETDLLYPAKAQSVFALYHEVSRIFAMFSELEHNLSHAVYHENPLQNICNLCMPFFRNPVAVYTTSFQLLCYSEKKKKPCNQLFYKEDLYAFSSAEEIASLTLHPEFSKSLIYDEPMIFPAELTGYRMLYRNLRLDGKNVARFMSLEFDEPIKPSNYALTEQVSMYLEETLNLVESSFISPHSAKLDQEIRCLLHGKAVRLDEVIHTLSDYGWGLNDSYMCMQLLPSKDLQMGSVLSSCIHLEGMLPKSIAIQDGKYIAFIINLSVASLTRQEAIDLVVLALRDLLMKTGISTQFYSLERLPMFYQQASTALCVGLKQYPDLWTFRFENFSVDYALNLISEKLTTDCFIPDGLHKLINYDLQKNREYTKTLQIYLECNQSVTKASKKLFLQRQTFLYRLDRIKEISGLNLQDPGIVFYINMSFQMILRNNGQDFPGLPLYQR